MPTGIFVGNIPYDVKEEEIKEILSLAGPIVSFRIVTDKETGKPKGYGFCVYKDEETAVSAHRNLQGCEIRGRTLRINFANNDKDKKQSQPTTAENQTNQPPAASDPIALHLANLPRFHLIQVLSGFKALAAHNPQQARQLLQASPPLSRALLQALTMLELPPPPAQQPRNQEPQFPAHRSFPLQQVNEGNSVDPTTRPSKLVRVNDGRAVPSSKHDNEPLPQNQDVLIQQNQDVLLQQVLRLKPEQLKSLPLHQQQQIIQLQQMYSHQS